MLFLLPHTVSIAVVPPTLGACSIPYSALSAFYAPVEGIWKLRLAWSSDNPTCSVFLEEEALGQARFKSNR